MIKLVLPVVASATLCCAAGAHAADSYPVRPIRLIVPFSAGGAADIIARLMAGSMSKTLNTQIVVDTRPGAGTVLGTDIAAHSSPDGYTLVLVATAHSTNPGLVGKLPYDSLKDFSPITLAVDTPLVIVVPSSLPVTNLHGLIDLAKDKPQRINYGSAGQGTSGHLAMELLSFKTGVKLTHIPYKGASQALVDLLGAQIQVLCTSTLPALPHVRSGQLRALAVTTAARSRAVPDIPTVAEAAQLPGFRASSWYALLAPANTQPAIVKRVHESAVQALRSPAVTDQLLAQGAEPIAGTPEELRQFLRTEIETWTTVIRQAGIKAAN